MKSVHSLSVLAFLIALVCALTAPLLQRPWLVATSAVSYAMACALMFVESFQQNRQRRREAALAALASHQMSTLLGHGTLVNGRAQITGLCMLPHSQIILHALQRFQGNLVVTTRIIHQWDGGFTIQSLDLDGTVFTDNGPFRWIVHS